jgi:hypothetical protein
MSDELIVILDRIVNGQFTDTDLATLRQFLESGDRQLMLQLGKYHVNIGEGKDIHIGNKVYQELNEETIQAIADHIFHKLQTSNQVTTPAIASVDELVQQVRSRLHDDIQRLHGTMPLWGVDHWVPLGDLFVDVNILEELSSSRRSEIDDLWQDFSQNPSYRSLDRIGLGNERKRISGLEILTQNKSLMVVGVRQRFLHLRDIRVDLHLKQSGRWFISSQSGFNDSKKTYVFLVQHLMCL